MVSRAAVGCPGSRGGSLLYWSDGHRLTMRAVGICVYTRAAIATFSRGRLRMISTARSMRTSCRPCLRSANSYSHESALGAAPTTVETRTGAWRRSCQSRRMDSRAAAVNTARSGPCINRRTRLCHCWGILCTCPWGRAKFSCRRPQTATWAPSDSHCGWGQALVAACACRKRDVGKRETLEGG